MHTTNWDNDVMHIYHAVSALMAMLRLRWHSEASYLLLLYVLLKLAFQYLKQSCLVHQVAMTQ